MEHLCLWIGGFYNLAFVIFHLMFWKVFKWKESLSTLSFLNRAVMQVLNIHLAYALFIFVIISFFHIEELLNTALGQTMLLSISIFWFLRALNQILFFGFKKAMSIVLFIIFLIGGVLYFIPVVK